jgi:ribonuclease VapC
MGPAEVIVDSSALVAVLRDEPDGGRYALAIEAAPGCSIAAPTMLETSIVLGTQRHGELDAALDEMGARIIPFTVEHAKIARAAYARYGKKSQSPAQLNFGDCFSYALAIATGEPLLFKGDDFTHTDVTPAIGPGDQALVKKPSRTSSRATGR